MKQKMKIAQISRMVLWLSLIVCGGFAAVRAQVPPDGTVIPLVCFESKPETFTRTLRDVFRPSDTAFSITPPVPPGFYRGVINPGGATEESFHHVGTDSGEGLIRIISGSFSPPQQNFLYTHAVGETVLMTTDGDAVFGYNNLSSATVNILRGVLTKNYFNPGALTHSGQPNTFQPGVHEDAMRLKTVSGRYFTWFLNGGQAIPTGNASQNCGTITYQGRLSDAGAAANGQFDLQFQAFDTETGGTSQSELIKLENVPVTNGVFTVSLKFGSTLINNFKAQFLEIGVRAGSSTGAFTTLAPRQRLTQVPFAVNAQTAQTAFDVRLQLTAGVPPSAECDETNERGRMKVDATNNKLYVCTATGWKAFVPQ